MNVREAQPAEYGKLVQTPFSVFDGVGFSELNAAKVDAVKYLVFNDDKDRFGLIAGVKDGQLKAPFSAPYACFSEIGRNNKIASYGAVAPSLIEYAKSEGIKRIRITFPPSVYDESHIAKLYNSFYVAGFRIAGCDLNFQYDLRNFDEKYEMSIDPKARQKLRAAMRNGLVFERTEDIATAYAIIRANREAKNYPLWMTYENVLQTVAIVKADFFLVRAASGEAIASAMVYEVSPDKVQVIYWGNLPGSDDQKPMNFLAYHIFDYYNKKRKSFFDIGPSTEFSVPNVGLCNFKQAIGCDVSTKMTYEKEI